MRPHRRHAGRRRDCRGSGPDLLTEGAGNDLIVYNEIGRGLDLITDSFLIGRERAASLSNKFHGVRRHTNCCNWLRPCENTALRGIHEVPSAAGKAGKIDPDAIWKVVFSEKSARAEFFHAGRSSCGHKVILTCSET